MGKEAKWMPERPTLVERLVMALHLPYAPAAFLLTVTLGLLLPLLGGYLDNPDLSGAIEAVFGTQPIPPDNIISTLLSSFLAPFYFLLMIRYMRSQLVKAESHLLSITPNGEG